MSEENYKKYRGKCKEYCEALIEENPKLRMVRGYYYEPHWSRDEPHWWCVDKDGNIHDPTKLQFPSGGIAGFYREFSGLVYCEECGKEMQEKDASNVGNYPICSDRCAMNLVGVYN